MPIALVPQSTDVAGGSNAQLLKAMKERKALAEMLAGGTPRQGGQERAPAFAPSSAGQAAFGYAGVAANALGDRAVMEREKADQAKRLQAGAESLKAIVPQFKDMPTATIMGLMIADPELPSKLAVKQFDVNNRPAREMRGGLYDERRGGWVMAPEPKTSERDPQKTYVREPAATGGAPVMGPGGAPTPAGPAPQAEVIQEGKIDPSGMRKEWTGKKAYTNLSEARPIYEAMFKTAGTNSRASDLNLVYGLGKIFDPGSVVREGEMIMVKNTAAIPEWLVGQINTLNGGAALTPDTRRQVMKEAYDRMSSYEEKYADEAKAWGEIAKRNKIAPEDVIIPFERSRPWEPKPAQPAAANPVQSAQQPAPAADPYLQEAIRRGLISPDSIPMGAP